MFSLASLLAVVPIATSLALPAPAPDYLEASLPHYTAEIVERYEAEERARELLSLAERSHPDSVVKEVIREVFGDHAKDALVIAACESRFVATSTRIDKKETSLGVFQVNILTHPEVQANLLFEPRYNVEYAKTLFDRRGWRDWFNCATKNGLL